MLGLNSTTRLLAKVLIAFASVFCCKNGQADSFAILIGVENYDKVTSLRFIDNDVDTVANVLTKRGMYPVENVARLSERAVGARITQDFLKEKVTVLLDQLSPTDSLFFYFSGHGTQVGDQELFLCPSDIDPMRPRETGIAIAWLKERLDACKAASKILVLDCCHAGSQKTLSPIKMAYLESPIWGNSDLLRMASCNASQVSLLWEDKQQSLFSFWMIQALKGFADRDYDGSISFEELYDYVFEHVPGSAKREHDREQTPVRDIPFSAEGHTIVSRYKPTNIKSFMTELGETLLQTSEDLGYDKVAILDLQDNTLQSSSQLGGDFALLGRKCAQWLYDEIPENNKIQWRQLQAFLAKQQFEINSIGDLESVQRLSHHMKTDVAIVTGTFKQRTENSLQVVVELLTIDPKDRSLKSSSFHGCVNLNTDELTLLATPNAGEPPGRTQQQFIHPLADPNFEFPIEIRVNQGGQWVTRVGRFDDTRENYIVFLEPGEEYRIYVGNKSGSTVAMRLLVDGLDTIYHEGKPNPCPVDFTDARCWILDRKNLPPALEPKNDPERWAIKGFMMGPILPNQPAKPVEFSQFTVGDASASWAGHQRFTENVGMISAAFYSTVVKNDARQIGTIPGRTIEEKINVRRNLVPAEKLAVVHIRYARAGR